MLFTCVEVGIGMKSEEDIRRIRQLLGELTELNFGDFSAELDLLDYILGTKDILACIGVDQLK